jgi:hypothetical protein
MDQVKKDFICGQPIICQLLSMIPSNILDEAINETGSDRYYKQMKSKEHFICMFYAVLTKNGSLREVCKNIILIARKLIGFGLRQLPCRSTLSDANRNRGCKFFASVYLKLYLHYRIYLRENTFSLPIGDEIYAGRVEIFDSTTITLFKEILKGAGRNRIDGKKKGGIKACTKINLLERVPNFVCFKAAARNENSFLQAISLEEGSIAVFDKGFNKYWYYNKLTESNRCFVTRIKDNAKYEVVGEIKLSDGSPDILKDQIIRLAYKHKKITRTVDLRLVTYRDFISGETLQFLTNLFDHSATTIALLYKNRWVIEVLFKQIKQNFEVKYFLSDSENGIKSQIWMALILNLIFTVLHKMTKEAEDFSTMVQVAAKNLCSYVNLIKFLVQTEAYCKAWLKAEVRNIQLSIFEGGNFEFSQ